MASRAFSFSLNLTEKPSILEWLRQHLQLPEDTLAAYVDLLALDRAAWRADCDESRLVELGISPDVAPSLLKALRARLRLDFDETLLDLSSSSHGPSGAGAVVPSSPTLTTPSPYRIRCDLKYSGEPKECLSRVAHGAIAQLPCGPERLGPQQLVTYIVRFCRSTSA
jgi:hypothetical protein